jgi:hypothetical protein
MKQIARNVTMEGWGALRDCRYLLHDRDTKFTCSLRAIIASGRVEPVALPVRSPDLNAYSERWVRSVKEECLSKMLLIGERPLRLALSEYVAHYQPFVALPVDPWAFASSIVVLAQVQSTSSHRIIRDFSARLRGFLMIIMQQPAQPFATLHRPASSRLRVTRKQQDVVLPLMITLRMGNNQRASIP